MTKVFIEQPRLAGYTGSVKYINKNSCIYSMDSHGMGLEVVTLCETVTASYASEINTVI